MQPTPQSYSKTAVILHWLTAIAVIALIGVGLTMKQAHLPPARLFQLYQLHKSLGVTVLLLTALRLGWRFTHRPPDLPTSMKAWERWAAHAGHASIYLFLIGLPLTGWAVVSVSPLNIPTVLYGLVPWPHLPWFATVEDKKPVESLLKMVHDRGAFIFIAVLLGHIGAAGRHAIKGDVPMSRMSLRGAKKDQ